MRPVLFAHATGFCSGVWEPVAREVGEARLLDLPGHGGTPEPDPSFTWWVFGEFVADHAPPGSIGVGHSMGGAALLMAEAMHPGRFAALVVIEPIVFDAADFGFIEGMVEQAERRRDRWPDRESAHAHLAGKPVFARWHPAAIEGYLRTGLVESPDGEVRLACRPGFEATVYRRSHTHRMWGRLDEVSCPVLVIAGSDSDTYAPGQAAALAEHLPAGASEVVEGTGHFLPMERPQRVLEVLARIRDQIAE